MWPHKKSNIINIINISSVKKYVPGFKPSSILENETKVDKRIRKVPGSDKDTKAPATKEPSKTIKVIMNMIHITLNDQVANYLAKNQIIRRYW